MQKSKLGVLLVFGLILFFQSCTEDDAPIEISHSISELNHELVRDWYDLYLDIEKDLEDFRPNPTARALGYIGLAAYETGLPGMPEYISMSTILDGFELNMRTAQDIAFWEQIAPNNYFWLGAINQSFKTSLTHFLIGMDEEDLAKIEALYQAYDQRISARLSDRDHRNATSHGEDITNQVISYAQSDSQAEEQILTTEPANYEPPKGKGLWQPTAPDFSNACHPYWYRVRTFIVPIEDVQLMDPPEYGEGPSSRWFQEANEVSQRVASLTKEDVWIAEFWSDDLVGITFSPPARQVAIANQLVEEHDLALDQTLKLYMMLGLALNDAAVHAWAGKYEYNLERPEDYIRRLIDPNFEPILGHAQGITGLNPNFPAYPSGHSTFASTGASIFKSTFGNQSFTDRCHEDATRFDGRPRSFDSFDQMAIENAYSRIPLGVHFRMDCDEGLRLGYEVGGRIGNIELRIVQ